MDRASSTMLKVMFTMAIGQITRPMASEFIPLPKVHDMRDIGEMTISMDLALKICQVVPSLKVSITWATKKDRVSIHMQPDQFTKENGSLIKSRAMADRPGTTVKCTTDNGLQTTCMDTDTTYMQTR